MKIAILGATGTAGRPTVAAATAAGHEVLALTRAHGVDLSTGKGLLEGVAGVDAVIDASNVYPDVEGADLVDAISGATERLVEACRAAGVPQLVHLSICSIDDPTFDGFPYYLAKRAQEEVVRASDVPSAIVRSAQWMEFAMNPAAVTETDEAVSVEDWLIQPVAVATVAEVLVEAATSAPRDRQVAGPEQIHLPELTSRYLAAISDPRRVEAVSPDLPELESGVLLAPAEAELRGPTPQEWLAEQAG